MSSLLLSSLRCENRERPPVWLMRQSGRYLPSYQLLRKKHSLRELFFEPELSVEATLLPIKELQPDAAILFSDITVIAEALGFSLDFKENYGPVITPLLVDPNQEKEVFIGDVEKSLACVAKATSILRKELSVPLIGFCGGPFTVASYLIERRPHQNLPDTKKWIYRDPKHLHSLLEKITKASSIYLDMQIKAGAQVIQIFDSWAHVLSEKHFEEFSLFYLKKIMENIKSHHVPVILFLRGSCLFPEKLANLSPNGISFDWQSSMPSLRKRVPPSIAIQGNLDPDLLYAPCSFIEKEVKNLLTSMKGDRGFIVNLGHGIKPDVPPEAVRCLIDTVKSA